jgi:hypothetical protein
MSNLTVGSLSGLSANNFVIDVASGSKIVQPGAVLQVVSTTKTDTFSTTSTTYTDITGLSVTITPTLASSKIFVQANVSFGRSAVTYSYLLLLRDSTAIARGDAAGSRDRATGALYPGGEGLSSQLGAETVSFLDTPNTTSPLTYKLQTRVGAGTGFVNRSGSDSDTASFVRTVSTITLMEIAG